MQRQLCSLAFAAAALAAGSCASGDPTGGNVLVVANIVISPPGATLIVGQTQGFTAEPRTSSGVPVPGRSVTWSSSNATLASVSTAGVVTAHAAGGPITITARVDNVTASVQVTVSPVPVASVVVEPPQAELLIGGSAQFTATPRDAQGQPLSGRQVGWTTVDPAIASVTTGGMVVAIAQGKTTVRATVEGQVGTAEVTVLARPATRLGFVSGPGNGVAGQALPPVQVAVQDEVGGTVPNATNPITVALADNPGGSTLGGTLTRNAVNGVATFNDLILQRAASGYTLRATADLLGQAMSGQFAIAPAAGAALAITTQPSSGAVSGQPLVTQPVVQLRDAFGNAVSQTGVQVTAALVGAGATLSGTVTVATNATGAAVFTDLTLTGQAGPYTIRFTAPGLTEVTSTTVTLGAGVPAALAIIGPPSSTAQSSVPLAAQPVVELRDFDDNPVLQAGVAITASVQPASGALAGQTTVFTNAQGQAAFTNLAIIGPVGEYTLTFSATGITGATSDPITLSAGPAAGLAMETQPSGGASSGVPFATQPAVRVVDGVGNPVAEAGIVITVSLLGAGGTLDGTLAAVTDADGIATFTDLAITGGSGTYQLSFTAPGLTGVTSGNVILGAGAPAQLLIATQPSATAQSGVPFTQQPQIQVADGSGNPTPEGGVVITAALASGPGTLDGTLTAITNGAGLATFTDLQITGPADQYTIAFSAPGLAGVTSGTITITVGAATQLALISQPSTTAQSGVPLPAQPVVQIQDAGGVVVPAAGVSVTAVIASGGGTLQGTVSVLTDGNGEAVFTNLAISGLVGDRTLRFDAAGLTSATSNTISLEAGPAAVIAANSATSQSATVATTVAAPPSVLVTDLAGNPVSGTGVTFTVTAGGGSTVPASGSVVLTNAAGIAALTSWTLGTTAGVDNNAVTAASAGLTGSPVTFTASANAGAAATIAANSSTSQSATAGTAVAEPPSALVTDQFGNPVSGVSVTFTVTAGDGTLDPASPAVIQTGADGTATVTSWTLGPSAGVNNNSVTAEAAGLAGSPVTYLASGFAGSATNIAAASPTSQSATVATAVASPPSVIVTDIGGNPVEGVPVAFAVTQAAGGGSTVPASPTVVVTNAAGIAALTSWTLGTQAGVDNNAVQASATGLTGSPVTFTASGLAGAPTTIAANSLTSQSATVGTTVGAPPSARVTDTHGNPVGGVNVTFAVTVAANGGAISPASPAVLVTGADGTATLTSWTLGTEAGTDNNAVTATAAGLAGSPVTYLASGTAGAAATIAANSLLSQSATVATAVGSPPSVLVTDSFGNPVSGFAVAFAVTQPAGGGSTVPASPAAINTNSLGIATLTSWTLGTQAGTDNNAVTATATGLTGSPIVFTASGTAGAAANLAANSVTSQSATVATTVSAPPSARVTDTHGNPVSGVAVTFTVTLDANGGTISPASPAVVNTLADGTATLTSWTLGTEAGVDNNRVTATAAGLAGSPVTYNASGTAGAATTIAANSATSQSATVLTAVSDPPEVLVTDTHGNPVSGVNVTFAVASGGGTTSPASPAIITTNASGLAALTSWTLGPTAGSDNNSVTATAGGLGGSPVTFTASGLTGAATSIAANSIVSQSATVNTAVAAPPSVIVRDAGNNPVSGVAVTFTVTQAATGGTISPASPAVVNTLADGTATLTSWTLGTDAGVGNNAVQASATGLSGSPVTFTASGVADAAAIIAANSLTSQSATVSSPVGDPPEVLVTDQHGNPVSGVSVTFAVASGGGTTDPASPAMIATNASGLAALTSWTLGPTAGTDNNSVTATAAGLTGSPVLFEASGTTGAATQLGIITQPPATARSGITLSQDPVVELLDAGNNPVAGADVTVSLNGGGSLTGTLTRQTAANGRATFDDLVITGTVGAVRTLTFTSGALDQTSTDITLEAGAATQLAITTGPPATITNGEPITPAIVVQLRDAQGNDLDSAGATITAVVASGPAGAVLTNDSQLTGADGAATFTGLTLTGDVGTYTLRFEAAGLTSATTGNIAVEAGDPATLAIQTQPGTTTAQSGADLDPQPVVLVTDVSGNPVSGVLVTASVLSGSGSVAGGTTATTAANGLAAFSGLRIDGTVGSYTLRFSAGALSDDSDPITLTVGPATQLAITTQPGGAVSDDPLDPQPVLEIRDSGGNLVSGATDLVTAEETLIVDAGGPGTLTGTRQVNASAGVVAFTDLVISGPGTYRIRFTAPGLTEVISAQIVITSP